MSLTVITWYGARRTHKSMQQLVMAELTDKPTLLCIASDLYTREEHLRPFSFLAEKFAGRLEVIVCAEWQQGDREREGMQLLTALGLAPEARPRLLRDEGEVRVAVVLRAKQPIALIDCYFVERAPAGPMYPDDGREAMFAEKEERVAAQIAQLLTKLPAQPPPPPNAPMLKAGQHDFNRGGICQLCGDGPMSRRECPGTKAQEPSRDRFELIELD